MSQKVTVEAELHGTEQVNAGFKSMGRSSEEMSKSMRSAASDVAVLGAGLRGFASLSKEFGIFNEEQAKTVQLMGSLLAVSGTLIRVTEVMTRANLAAASSFATKTAAAITDTAASWAATVAEKAHATALAIKNALLGPAGWAIIAGAAVAAGTALALTTQIPERHTGGPVLTSGPHNLLAGEYVLSREQVNNISNMGGVTINVYEGSTSNVLSALRRAGIR